ncbi:MAG: class I SAM-dependent methyltransferase [Candidatus Omnitrophica bacterium]|nr:class I SAM-dependent methyltransferase [Candidatus Omnitrophota bacterium]
MMQKTVHHQKLCWYGVQANENYWDAYWQQRIDRALSKARIPHAIKPLLNSLPPGAKVLEAGCGRGDKVKALLNQGFQAEGVDSAQKTVELLRGKGIPVSQMDVRQLHFKDSIFDAYLSFGVIEHFFDEEEARQTLREAIRVTKTGGRIFCSVPYTNKIRENYFLAGTGQTLPAASSAFYQRSYREDQLKDLFQGLPLRVIRIGYENPVKGISDEVPALKWLRNPFVALPLNFIHDQTGFLNAYGHMIYFDMKNQKVG